VQIAIGYRVFRYGYYKVSRELMEGEDERKNEEQQSFFRVIRGLVGIGFQADHLLIRLKEKEKLLRSTP
jgi:hypothetical protein